MSTWHDISTAPKNGDKVDLWVRWWDAATDEMKGRRIPDCFWLSGFKVWRRAGVAGEDATLAPTVRVTHWSRRPDDGAEPPAS